MTGSLDDAARSAGTPRTRALTENHPVRAAHAIGLICQFIDAFRHRFGVVPICRALSAQGLAIAPRTYWARKSRLPSRRSVRDALVTGLLAGMFEPGRDGRRAPESLYGAVKAWGHLRRRGVRVARCTVERIMRANGWRGSTRQARKVRTTVPDPVADSVRGYVQSGKVIACAVLCCAVLCWLGLTLAGAGCRCT